MRCLVTGGAGFIGSHLVDELLRRGHDVRVVDNFATGSEQNLAQVKKDIDLVNADVRDLDALQRAFQDIEMVFHNAAITSVPGSVEDPLTYHHVNATGTLNVLLAARETGVRRVIYASTSSVYGTSRHARKHEDMVPNPTSPYGGTKLDGEIYCRMFTQSYGLETLSLRYMTVFGPRQRASSSYGSAIPTFVTQMLRGETPVIYGDGRQSRDFIHIANAVHANILAMTTKKGIGEAFNIGSGRRVNLMELLEVLNQVLGTNIQPRFTSPRAGDVRHMVAVLTAAKLKLGYQPIILFSDGLKDTIAWFRQHIREYR